MDAATSSELSLAVECGPERAAAEQLGAHFPGELVRRDGTVHPLRVSVTQRPGHGAWCVVVPGGLSTRGAHCEREQADFDEMAWQLIERLKSASGFRYARVGLGVTHFREFNDLSSELVTGNFDGVILSEALWQNLGGSPVFTTFSDGYRWRPFAGVR